MRSWILTSAVTIFAIVFAAGSVSGQVIDEELLDELNSELDGLSRDVAEEYLDILENLSDLLQDYADYVQDMPSDAADHDVKVIGVMRENLRRGSYVENPEKLLGDLQEAIEGIKAVENQHRVKFNTNNPKCCRLGRGLRKELVINAELVEDYLDNQTVQVLQKDEIKKYVARALKALEEIKLAKNRDQSQVEEIRRAVEALKALGLEGRVNWDDKWVVVPPIPDAPELPEAPEAPEAPGEVWIYGGGKAVSPRGAQHQSQGQMTATHASWPIIIENPSGEIIVTGTSAKSISVVLNLEVASTSHAKEKEYFKQAVLMVAEEDGQYSVSVDLPRLSDHRTELIASTLEVSVPRTNRVQCTNAFGAVRISDVDGGVAVDGDKSAVELYRIEGGASVRNSAGTVTVESVTGDIDIETSYSPIALVRCSGKTILENEYGTITMTACEGVVEINNTGPIQVDGHTGNVTIENAYGRVEIDRLNGDLIATNGYQPLVVTEVTGSAELENTYSEISVEDVGKSLSATNSNGQIFVESTAGPVELSNSDGNISISLGRSFRGASTITCNGGTIKIAVLQQPDLTLSLHTIGGTITSSLPLSVKTRGDSKTAELILGDGSESLDVSGSGTTIIVQGR